MKHGFSCQKFIEELARTRAEVWPIVRTYLPDDKEPRDFYRMVREYPERRGKYFRPALLLLAAEMFGGAREEALLLAAAMQLSEDWLLVHDDVEDHSYERRSAANRVKPALQEIYGDELAINAGDALHIIMWGALGEAMRALGSERGMRAMRIMQHVLLTTTEGQHMELSWLREGKADISTEQYYAMAARKTSMYTVMGPVALGALAAEQAEQGKGEAGKEPPEIFAELAPWCLPFGFAFQVRDDTLKIENDIVEGKRTLILVHALAHAAPAERDYILAIYRKPHGQKSPRELEYVKRIFEACGSIAHAAGKANELAAGAEKLFLASSSRISGRAPERARDMIAHAIRFAAARS